MLYDDAKGLIRPDFIVGEKDDSYKAPEKVQFKIDSLVKQLKGKDLKNFNIPYVKKAMDQYLTNPDPELDVPNNIFLELAEKIVYAFGKPMGSEEKVIIAYLSIYCSI